ncbi:hypothetical protein Tco_1444896, partial [Tanacetum coccineum]
MQLAVLDLQRVPTVPAVLSLVPVEWSHVPVVTASMSKSAQATPVEYGQMSVMLQSMPASCGLPVASLRLQFDSYGQLPAAVRSLQLSHPSVDPLKGRQCYLLSSPSTDLSIYSIDKPIVCPTNLIGLAAAAAELSPTSHLRPRSIPNVFRGGSAISGLSALRSKDSNCKGGDEVGSGNAGNTDVGGDAGSGGDGICGNGDD